MASGAITSLLALAAAAHAGPRVSCGDTVFACTGFPASVAFLVANPGADSLNVAYTIASERAWTGFPRAGAFTLRAATDTTLRVALDLPSAEPAGTARLALLAWNADSLEARDSCERVVAVDAPLAPIETRAEGPVCAGGTLRLSATSVHGATYDWTGPDGFVSHDREPRIARVDGDASGRYCVVARTGGCATPPACVDVVVHEPPKVDASNEGPVCQGGDTRLRVTTVPGASYRWSGPAGFSSTLQNPALANVSQSGTYCVVVSAGGCESRSCTELVVHGRPLVLAWNNGPLVIGDTLRLGSTKQEDASYRWAGPFGFRSHDHDPEVEDILPLQSGTYCVVATVKGCESPAACTEVVVRPRDVKVESASATAERVRITWRSAEAAGIAIMVSRRAGDGPWLDLGPATFGKDDRLVFEDRAVQPAQAYAYRLCIVRPALRYCFEESEIETLEREITAPLAVGPNPARRSIRVEFLLAGDAPDARLDLVDVTGRARHRVGLAGITAGGHTLEIPVGDTIRPGIYLVTLVEGARRVSRRIAVVP